MKRSSANNGCSTSVSGSQSDEQKKNDLAFSSATNGSFHTSSHNNIYNSVFKNIAHFTLLPVFLLIFIPNLVILVWYTAIKCHGSLLEFVVQISDQGIIGFFVKLWTSVRIFSPLTSSVLLGYSIWAILLMVFLPGPRVEGPISPKGNIPIYKDNGFACYSLTMVTFVLFTVVLKLTGHTPTVIYDHFDEFIATMTVFSFAFCLLLYVKGRLWPSSSDSGSSGNFVFDYFWGLELYPRILGIDVKVFTNCRFGMTVWPLLVCIYALKSYELHGRFVDSMWVSAALQMIYITKFFWWEAGYMRTIDIKLDRAGYYICWGCLVYVPGIYASVSMYLVNQPIQLGPYLSAIILIAGLASCTVNYFADRQKQVVRSTDGNCFIWGRKPEVIRASYRLENGETHQSLLLVSGYWGIARHFHYVPELALAFLWTIPALFQNLLPFSYLIILLILLIHRTYRDDFICKIKYEEHWEEYVIRVPYKMMPYIF